MRLSCRLIPSDRTNIDEVFAQVKSIDGVHLINESPDYRPYFISPIKPRAIELPGVDRDTVDARKRFAKSSKRFASSTPSINTASSGNSKKDIPTSEPHEGPPANWPRGLDRQPAI